MTTLGLAVGEGVPVCVYEEELMPGAGHTSGRLLLLLLHQDDVRCHIALIKTSTVRFVRHSWGSLPNATQNHSKKEIRLGRGVSFD